MKAARISEIKTALALLTNKELAGLCVRLASFRKENKELLTYLLFEADDQQLFLRNAKNEISHIFIHAASNMYLAKKTYRKALKVANNYIKFASSKVVEVEILIHFCQCMNNTGNNIHDYPVTANMYARQVNRIEKALSTLHEDLQYDYGQEVSQLRKMEPS